LTLFPLPVKLRAFAAVSFEKRLQLGVLILALPWKLSWPVNARAHGGFAKALTLAMA
jgi:hypothetical protein